MKGIVLCTEGKMNYKKIIAFVSAILTGTGAVTVPEGWNRGENGTIQKIEAAAVGDFDEGRTVNLDENDDTNFFVLSEDTKVAQSTDSVNVLKSADYENGVFVFENADSTLENLEKGDYFYIRPDDENIIAVSVENVKSDGNGIVTVTDSGDDIGDMFDVIKIDSSLDMNDVPHILPFGKNLTVYTSDSYASGPQEYKFENGTISMDVDYSFHIDFNYYKFHDETDVMLAVRHQIGLDSEFRTESDEVTFADMSAETPEESMRCTLPLMQFNIPTGLPGCTIQWKPEFIAEFDGAYSVNKNIECLTGFVWSTENGFSKISNPGYVTETTAYSNGNCRVGVTADIKAEFPGSAGCDEITMPVFIGVKSEGKPLETDGAKYQLSQTEKEHLIEGTEDSHVHVCEGCIEGTSSLVIEADAEAYFPKTNTRVREEIIKLDVPEGKWHFSSMDGYGPGECTNIAYRTYAFLRSAENGMGKDGYYQIGSVKAPVNDLSKFIYCENGEAQISICDENDKELFSDTFETDNSFGFFEANIDEAGKVSVVRYFEDTYEPEKRIQNIGERVTMDGEYYYSPEFSDGHELVEEGSLGENILYMTYDNGNMYIYGSGKMDDFEKAKIKVPSKVKNVFIDFNAVSPITNIGSNLFSGCKNLESVNIPKYITSIGENAFYGCSSLTDVSYSRSIREWRKIDIASGNEALSDEVIHCKIRTLGAPDPKNEEEAESFRGKGDVNEDGIVDLTDLSYFSLYLLRDIDFTETAVLKADLDKNGSTDIADLATYKMFIMRAIELDI